MIVPPLVARHRALERTRARYKGRAFDWAKDDCWRMVGFHLRANGHRPPVLRYGSALSAKKALKAAGFESVVALMDSLLPRIAPAEMLPGDVAAFRGTEGLDALAISLGYKMMGWHQSSDTLLLDIVPREFEAAWRVAPKPRGKR